MRLDHLTWPEVEAHLSRAGGIILPVGSTEQHGPIGLIGTDSLCATAIAEAAAPQCGALVAPTLAFTPAPFNTAFPGTISISDAVFETLATEVLAELNRQCFKPIFVLNAHGANLAPLRRAMSTLPGAPITLRSWWDYAPVNALREGFYGAWEGMHATPSETAITMAAHRQPPIPPKALIPPRRLDADYIRTHAGDRHGAPDAHRRNFPDGRVGSHSALATPEQGIALLTAAATAVAQDYIVAARSCATG